ncbi:MAG: glycosyltransferase [Kofleriaceae bacterium]|nr:glycosyltransferase [Kofleriaceae bacterium]MCL4224316.1 glycosyltransferase [Myxococcales bacterium]
MRERARVGFIRHNFLPPSETFIYTSMNALADAGFDVTAFALRRRSAAKFPSERVTSLDAVRGGALSAALYRATTWSPRFFAWARDVHLLHAHMGYTGVHGLYAARRLGKPLVTSFYGQDVTLHRSWKRLDPTYWHYALRRRALFARGDRFCVLSAHMRAALVEQGCPEAKLRVVRLGVDLSRFAGERAPRGGGPTTVLMVGREVEKKGFDDGLRACAAARALGADLRVVVLGTGDAGLPALQRLAAELSLDVAWPDPATRVAAAMAEADVLLVPSRTARNGDQEGTPTVICEGSAAALPVVATRHAGIPEQVEHARTGLLADERDVDGLAAHLARLAARPDERAAMGAAGRAKMHAEYSVAAHVRDLSAVYRELL